MRRKLATTVVVAGAMALAACQSKAPDTLPPQPAGSTPPPDSAGPIPGSQADFLAQMSGRQVIYFDTDRYNIDSADAAALQTQAQWLSRYPSKRATVEGHADERGTREYNLALGARRAKSAQDFLVARGVASTRIRTISYGKERPVAVCDDISCWSQNRRAVTVLGGAGM